MELFQICKTYFIQNFIQGRTKPHNSEYGFKTRATEQKQKNLLCNISNICNVLHIVLQNCWSIRSKMQQLVISLFLSFIPILHKQLDTL